LVKSRKNLKTIALFLVFLTYIFCSEISHAAENIFNENMKRNWRESLNVYDHTGEHILLNVDEWFNTTLGYINEENEFSIRSKFERHSPNQSNIAVARFTIICNIEGNITFFPFDLEKIFVSGSNALNAKNEEVKQQKLLEKIILPISFIDGPRPSGKVMNATLQDNIKKVTGMVVKDATHSEGSILTYLFRHLTKYLSEKIDVKKQNLVIVGTILEISSLKDPCSEFCVPMLEKFMVNVGQTLAHHLPEFKIAHKLENLVLLSGRKEYLTSREGINILTDKIKLSFDNPNNRVFSKKIE